MAGQQAAIQVRPSIAIEVLRTTGGDACLQWNAPVRLDRLKALGRLNLAVNDEFAHAMALRCNFRLPCSARKLRCCSADIIKYPSCSAVGLPFAIRQSSKVSFEAPQWRRLSNSPPSTDRRHRHSPPICCQDWTVQPSCVTAIKTGCTPGLAPTVPSHAATGFGATMLAPSSTRLRPRTTAASCGSTCLPLSLRDTQNMNLTLLI